MSKELSVIGGEGLIGSEIVKYAESKGVETTKTVLKEKTDLSGDVEILDITNLEAVKDYFGKYNSHRFEIKSVIVAAGMALPFAADTNPEGALLVNAVGPRNICEAILSLPENNRPKVLFMGSALQYEVTVDGVAISEDNPRIQGGKGYIQSKERMIDFVTPYFKNGLEGGIAMIWQSSGDKQSTDYFFPKMADQAARIKLGLQKDKTIWSRYVGNSVDYSHVKDTARGAFLTLRGTLSGDLINICSGYATPLQDIIDIMKDLSGVPDIKSDVLPEYKDRKPKFMNFWGDNSKLKSMGIHSQNTMRDLCRDIFEARLKANGG